MALDTFDSVAALPTTPPFHSDSHHSSYPFVRRSRSQSTLSEASFALSEPDSFIYPLSPPPMRRAESETRPSVDLPMSDLDLGCNIPEMLAQDLEISNCIFEARNMTAGAPSVRLMPHKSDQHHHFSPASPYPVLGPMTPYKTTAASIRSLGVIGETDGAPLTHDEGTEVGCPEPDGGLFDSDSDSASEVSSVMEPPTVRFRQQSVMTAATSITWGSNSAPSPSKGHDAEPANESSWIDLDSDSSGSGQDNSNNSITHSGQGFSTPQSKRRESNGPSNLGVSFSDPFRREPVNEASLSGRQSPSPSLQHRSISPMGDMAPTAQSTPPRPSRRKISLRRLIVATESGRMSPQSAAKCEPTPRSPLSQTRHASPSPPQSPTMHGEVERMTRSIQMAQQSKEPASRTPSVKFQVTERDQDVSSLSIEDMPHENVPGASEPHDEALHQHGMSRSPVPQSPVSEVQSWLETSQNTPTLSSLAAPSLLDESASLTAVPLPPNIVESLRVSVTCFPETMLLSSSLTIETIRSYSRKLKLNGFGRGDESDALAAPMTRRSRLRRVLTARRSAAPVGDGDGVSRFSGLRRSNTDSSRGTLADSASWASCDTTPTWVALRNVFNTDSDHLCDALYAHLVAYNYVSCLVPRTPPESGLRRDNMCHTPSIRSAREEVADVPKKAASLLGMHESNPTAPATGRHKLSRRQPGAPVGDLLGKDMIPSARTQTPAQEAVMRDLQVGLARCIARLISTLRLATGNTGMRIRVCDSGEIDAVLVRSLCELVKCSEEGRV